MDLQTVIGALVLGFIGTILLGGVLNITDGGAILAIAFVGGRIVGAIHNNKKVDSNGRQEDQ